MSLTVQQVLLANGYLSVSNSEVNQPSDLKNLSKNQALVTILNNFHYYGFVPSLEVIQKFLPWTKDQLVQFWLPVEKALKELTGDNRQMDKFVVYQNFPKEVLEMSQVEYWAKQILMYWGVDKEHLVQKKDQRPVLSDQKNLKVLHLATAETLPKLFQALLQNKTRWTDLQLEQAKFLIQNLKLNSLEMEKVAFRENGIQLVNYFLDTNPNAQIKVDDATDVLRLAALRSDSDVSLRDEVRFKSFKRSERRFLCQLLENSKHLESDLAERQGLWKLLLQRLHPGDFKFSRVSQAYNQLYQGQLKSFASQVEAGIKQATQQVSSDNRKVLKLLQNRPGDFTRRLHKLYAVFDEEAVENFLPVMEDLTNHQLVKLVKYLETINYRKTLSYPPRGNWSRLQIKENTKKPWNEQAVEKVRTQAANLIKTRLQKLVPAGFDLDPQVSLIKLQTNDQELASYGRGTVFPIPANITFFRTASYWENKGRVSWFDNGWNLFDDKWSHLGAVCWNSNTFPATSFDHRGKPKDKNAPIGAIFSGDPVNSSETRGRACQMIDLYPEQLRQLGVRYAVWNILSYNKIPFSEVTGEVLATLQWGEQAETGKLYEPSRAQCVFSLQGNSRTKYVAYLDLVKNQLVYLDANLKANVQSATANGETLNQQMPAFLEYLESLPSLADLLDHADKGTVPVLYTDKNRELKNHQPAYVFKPENQNNQFKQLDLDKLLS